MTNHPRRRSMLLGSAGLALAAPALGQPARAKPDRIVVNASGGAMANIFRRTYFAEFEKLHGIRVVDTSPVDFGKLRAMVESGNPEWTVTEIGGQDATRVKQMNLVEPLDASIIERSGYPAAAIDSHVYVSSAYSTALGFRTDVFPNGSQPKGWAQFWDVKRFPGPRSLRNHPVDNLEFALLADGVPKDKLYPLDMDRAFRKLDEIRPHIVVWWTTGAQPAQLLVDKEVVLATGWNGRFFELTQLGRPGRHRLHRGQPEEQHLRHPARHPAGLLGPAVHPGDDQSAAAGGLCDRALLCRLQPGDDGFRAGGGAAAAAGGAGQPREAVLARRRLVDGERREGAGTLESLDAPALRVRLSVQGIVKRFGATTALGGVDLDLAEGEFLTILGPSGSGKTTLLKVVAGFEAPDAGGSGSARRIDRGRRRGSATSAWSSRTTRCSRI